MRVRLGETEIRRDVATVDGQDSLDEAGNTGRGLEVTDVRLDRTDEERIVGAAAASENGTQCPCFDGIA
ncbi:Uncharacterised protein [Mycobacteroides abscessus subsp. abscessus]|nr:Uncharacterised protein [Mycobacteroides abscessus subsp. abscessus]